jgi:hypothetical protein
VREILPYVMIAANCCGLPIIGFIIGFFVGRGYRVRLERS